MVAITPIRCTVAAPGVEVVTVRAALGGFRTTIHNGPLDGESFAGASADAQHDWAVRMARDAGGGAGAFRAARPAAAPAAGPVTVPDLVRA